MQVEARRRNLVVVQPLAFGHDDRESGALGPAGQWQIGQGLRALYDGLVEAPLPERLQALIAGLEKRLG